MEPRKDLLQIEDLSREEIEFVLKTAQPYKELFKRSVKKMPTLQGKAVLNLFYEPSTRTRSSFEVAAKRLSADVTNLAVSEFVGGQGRIDPRYRRYPAGDARRLHRRAPQGVRHSRTSSRTTPARLSVNAGDGYHAHPTQAMLDAYTLREQFPG